MMHLQIKADDPQQNLAEILDALLDALAAHLRENGEEGSVLLITGSITGVEATADIRWEVEK